MHPKDHTFEALFTEIQEAMFAEALPRQDAGPELAQKATLREVQSQLPLSA